MEKKLYNIAVVLAVVVTVLYVIAGCLKLILILK